ncbi:restriction endonuclease [Streptomyces sp. XM4193]|uniref:restriction endonuclease n=1 Tax=Streptomyces sp. XM4193 TaxID=2929782 RepID=UPI001FF9B9A2|nr:restriction endonuclease [Streptomyces sp. XM4193]MCK1794475.1 restriction endonuclease [Streptomyces sp. XM4193]
MSEAAATEIPWTLRPGDEIERKKLHRTYGGRRQGGIGPSAKTPNVFVFTDPAAGEQHGYYDGWMPDSSFHYSGEGQRGDQSMKSGNAAILNHRSDRRALRVFKGARGTVTYQGEFVVDADNPWYTADAPETDGGPLRRVIIFRLLPVDTSPQAPTTSLGRFLEGHPEQVKQLPLERHETESTFVSPSGEVYEAQRRERLLIEDFTSYLNRRGHHCNRQTIRPPGETRPLFTDVYVNDLGLLVEAKGSVTRENVRMAIGQLADYGRFVDHGVRAILLPSKPRDDLLDLANAQECAVIWPEGESFTSTDVRALPRPE